MEPLIDLTTHVGQGITGVVIVILLGWAWAGTGSGRVGGGKRGAEINTLRSISRTALLPALIFTTFASSPNLTWLRLAQQWPAIVIALIAHLPSIAFGLLSTRYGGGFPWLTETMAFNNSASYPVVLLQLLYLLSNQETVLGHLKWRVLDTLPRVLQRATEYALLNLVIVEVARMALCNILPSLLGHVVVPDIKQSVLEDETENGQVQNDEPAQDPPSQDDDSAVSAIRPTPGNVSGPNTGTQTERTPLLASETAYGSINGTSHPHSPSSTPTQRVVYFALHPSPIIIAALLGLFIGLIKPLQRALIGQDIPDGVYTGGWKSIGGALILLGTTFGTLDLFAEGAALRLAGAVEDSESSSTPILGTILVTALWRYLATPFVVYGVVRGFKHIDSVSAYLQDPAFSFILVLVNSTPPSRPAHLTPIRARIHLWLHILALIASPAIALGITIAGRGVSLETGFDLKGALRDATGDGVAGAMAMVLQVLLLMPLRTVMNYQYRYGGTIRGSVGSLYADGGVKRYYAGMGAALFQGPLSRFGDTAANAFILSLLSTLTWPVLIKTIAASLGSAAFRMFLTPIDTIKTTQQTRGGKAGLKLLKDRIRKEGVQCLWWGALAAAAATFVGHYPWFGTYNYLSEHLPIAHTPMQQLARRAFIGFAASVASDTISNSLRVVKTYRQVHEGDVGYFSAARDIIRLEGVSALFGRGLPVRLLTNGLQGIIFSILWRRFADLIKHK